MCIRDSLASEDGARQRNQNPDDAGAASHHFYYRAPLRAIQTPP